MRFFWWQHLRLLILIQLLKPGNTNHKIYAAAEAIGVHRSIVGSHKKSSDRIGKYPCLRQGASVKCNKLKDPGVVSLRITASVPGDNGIPTLTPLQPSDVKKTRKHIVAAIIGGFGAALLVIVIVVLVYIFLMRIKKFIRRTSDTASSVPSPPNELERGNTSPYANASPYDTQDLVQLTIVELQYATSNFSQSNIIGEGAFGLVYKGFLQDGSIVAIKRRVHSPNRYFVHEVKHIARVHHKNLVKLVGYCQDNYQQLLVYDHIPNGNVGSHLYDSEGLPIGKLNMRQRLLIAFGAAKGLEHLHSLVPPLLHMHFRSSNVLLDDNFTAKISDYGLLKLITDGERAGSSSVVDCFLDPELNSSKDYSAQSDVYSFGVFLLELISGHEAHGRNQQNCLQNFVLQAKYSSGMYDNFIDKALGDHSMRAAEEVMKLALKCVDISPKRASMKSVVEELEQIQEREIGHLHSEFGEDIGAVTLGSELFK
ncbi:Pkinase_Tyr domain-containing protein [Cephalotus follicularis]|uniref:non-specific serine/threonine protein kinase n=1 Tax=Cephalotus follicularis TaxID=3775 RepID=A0A1Q3BEM6_CEPFO|nr:Pkinase_Tyr domain-containing protein [Cephalotus follicularis]